MTPEMMMISWEGDEKLKTSCQTMLYYRDQVLLSVVFDLYFTVVFALFVFKRKTIWGMRVAESPLISDSSHYSLGKRRGAYATQKTMFHSILVIVFIVNVCLIALFPFLKTWREKERSSETFSYSFDLNRWELSLRDWLEMSVSDGLWSCHHFDHHSIIFLFVFQSWL
jgi:hypothetical protein